MTATACLTADTITAAEIRDLRRRAGRRGDHDLVEICDVALAAQGATDSSLLEGPYGSWTRDEARAACADAINAAQEQP